jgi:hypothetical protein
VVSKTWSAKRGQQNVVSNMPLDIITNTTDDEGVVFQEHWLFYNQGRTRI